MTTCALAPYTVRAYINSQPCSRLDRIQLGSNNVVDLLTLFYNYFNNLYNNIVIVSNIQKVFNISRLTYNNREINALIESGEYGYEAELYDINNKVVSHVKKESEAELLPFYIFLYIPKAKNEGILLLSRIKQLGIRKLLEDNINEYLSQSYGVNNLKIEFNPIIDKELIKAYLDSGRICEVRFIRFGWSNDIVDVFTQQDHKENEGVAELVIKPKKGGGLRKDIDYNHIELRDFKYDAVKIEVEIDGRRRTIDITHNKLRSYYDITESVDYEKGLPTYESIDRIAKRLFRQLRNYIYGDLDV
ncbi:MAG: hypothetical protein QW416_09240 [Candidatus Nitrosocaldaceae archaeon]